MKCKILTWEDFREVCKEDAYKWYNAGYIKEELTEEDVLNEYPEDYFEDDTDDDYDELSNCFTPKDFAQKTLEYLGEIEDEE